ncbi:MAG TPA: peptidoglycan-binding domain-containing protein [Allocoleopsis sp.]
MSFLSQKDIGADMEALAYLHLSQNYETPENETLDFDLRGTLTKAAIGFVGLGSIVGVVSHADQASAYGRYYGYYPYYPVSYNPCPYNYYPSSYNYYPRYNYYPVYSYYPSYNYYPYYPDYSSYYPDYSDNYYPTGYDESGNAYYEVSGATYTDEGLVGTNTSLYGDQGPFVASLQQTLADLGYYQGPIDGIYGPLTADAVMVYQADKGLVVDGIAGGQTLDSLGLAGYGA